MLEPGAALRLITEADFLRTTTATLRHSGYDRLLHIIDAKAHAKVTADGWPDIFAIHPQHGLLIAELKTETGRAPQPGTIGATTCAGICRRRLTATPPAGPACGGPEMPTPSLHRPACPAPQRYADVRYAKPTAPAAP